MQGIFGIIRFIGFVMFGGLFFLDYYPPFTLGGHNFFNFNPFLMIFSMLNMSIGGAQVLFGHQKQWSPPFGLSLYLERLSNCS
jgi:hypothetical protein